MKRILLPLLVAAFAVPATAQAGNVTMTVRDVPLAARATQSAPAPGRFNMLGLHWQGSGRVEYRTRALDGGWSLWRAADADTGPDPGSGELRQPGWHDGNLDWVGAARGVQFRRFGDVTRLRAYYLWSKPKPARATRTIQLAGSPTIVPRSSWEADEKITRDVPYYAPALKLAIVHHTAGTNQYSPSEAAAIVRGIEVYHVKGNGWNDIGYNFLVDRFGTVYEGRAGGITRNVIGAQALGFNTGTVGVALIGNYDNATPTAPEQASLVRLLAWRLDIAHVDPLSQVVYTSSGSTRYKAGKVVTLRAISGHRDTNLTGCPGAKTYALLPSIARRVAQTGLPKLYSVTAAGALGGPIRFQGRLTTTLVWSVTVTTAAGKLVARGAGRSAQVGWTWNSAKAGKGPFTWRMDAGATVYPAQGTLGTPLPEPPKPTSPTPAPTTPIPATPVVPAAPAPAPTPAPVTPAKPAIPLVSALSVSPATITPASDGTGLAATVKFTLASAANVTVTVTPYPAGLPVLTPFSGRLPAGPSIHQWDIGILPNGRYKLTVSALAAGAVSPVTNSIAIAVDRTLGAFLATPPAFSPNGDGVNDTMTLSFQLTQPAYVQVAIQRAGVTAATVFSAQLQAGTQTIGWDGTSGGVRLPDGDYAAVVTATSALGTVSLLQTLTIDTTAPTLTLVDGPSLRLDLSEPATVTAVVNGQTLSLSALRGAVTIPWSGPVTSFTAQARDGAGNLGPPVSWP